MNNVQTQWINVYRAYNVLGFPVGEFRVVATPNKIFGENELNEIAETSLKCEVVSRCEKIDTLDICGRSMQNAGKVKLREGKYRFKWPEELNE